MRTYVKKLWAAASRRVSHNTPCVRSGDSSGTDGLLLFPVPAHEMLNIELEFELEKGAQFELYDLTGKMIASTKLQKQSKTGLLGTVKLSPGIYAYRLVGGDGRFYGTVNIQH